MEMLMAEKADRDGHVGDGDYCLVLAGTHSGKSGVVQDRKASKTGHITITVKQDDGVRFKTLARNVEKRPRP
jgi:ribosomal protein S4E